MTRKADYSMRNEETKAGTTGSLPRSIRFLQHGVPGPQPAESEAELERAEQAEFNLFVDDDGEPEAAAAADEAVSYDLTDPEPEGQTASIARIVASVFAGVEHAETQAGSPLEETASSPVMVSTADASRPLPRVEMPEQAFYSGDLSRNSAQLPLAEEIPGASESYEYQSFEAPSTVNPPQTISEEAAPLPENNPAPAAAAPKAAQAKASKPGAASKKKGRAKSGSKPAASVLKSTGGGSTPLPGTNFIRITESGVKDSASFRQMLLDIRERQKESLPSKNASVRSAVKRLEMRSHLDQILNPVRYLIILVMVLCLAGRRFQWMTLGFMSGMQGVRVAIFMTIISMIISWQSAKRSVKDIFYLKPSYETWLLIASLLTAEEALVHTNTTSLMPVLAICWCFSGIADYKNHQAQLRSGKAFVKARRRKGLCMRQVSRKKGRSLIGQAKASSYGFVRHQEETDVFHRIWMLAGPVLFVLLLILTAYIKGRTGKLYMTVLVMLMDMAAPAALALCCARPYELFVGSTRKHGVVAGWFGMQQLSGQKSMLLYDSDFYPSGTISKKEIRLYAPIDINTFISYASCLGLKGNIGYRELLIDIMREVHGSQVDVDELEICERGVKGRIHNETVSLGTYEFMQLEGCDLPQQAARDSLFLAVGKQLAGEIVVSYQVKRGASGAFRHLQHEPGLYTMVAARNFLITPGYIRKTFKTGINKLVCLKAVNRRKLAGADEMEKSEVCGYLFHEGIVSYGLIVAGARRTYRAGFWMTVLSLVTAVILIIRTSLTLLQRLPTPTGTGLITLNLILFLVCELVSRLSAGNPE